MTTHTETTPWLSNRTPILWGLAFGVFQAAVPVGFFWLEPVTVLALSIVLIAAIYIGFAVADGRPAVIAVETVVAAGFVVVGAAAITGTPWLLVIALAAHGCKDLWQEHSHFVRGTRWWPPFCAAVDFSAASIIAVAIAVGGLGG